MLPVSRIIVLILISTAIILADVMFSYGQTISIGGRVTTGLVRPVEVKNPSPSNIYGEHDININVGIFALKYFKESRMGVKLRLEAGGVPFMVGIDAPRKAFGTGGGGESQIGSLYSTNAFTYKAFTISAAYKLPLKSRFIEFTAGPSIRHYGYDRSLGWEEMRFTFNRSAPF